MYTLTGRLHRLLWVGTLPGELQGEVLDLRLSIWDQIQHAQITVGYACARVCNLFLMHGASICQMNSPRVLQAEGDSMDMFTELSFYFSLNADDHEYLKQELQVTLCHRLSNTSARTPTRAMTFMGPHGTISCPHVRMVHWHADILHCHVSVGQDANVEADIGLLRVSASDDHADAQKDEGEDDEGRFRSACALWDVLGANCGFGPCAELFLHNSRKLQPPPPAPCTSLVIFSSPLSFLCPPLLFLSHSLVPSLKIAVV